MPANSISIDQPLTVDSWDAGQLRVNVAEKEWLQTQGLNSFEALWALQPKDVYRQVGERVTSRHELPSPSGTRVVYVKRHGRITWKERLKSWSRLQWPVWGARPEWEAILAFHRHGVPTMTPIACGESQGRSLLMTAGLENCVRLDHWLESAESRTLEQKDLRRQMLRTLAGIVRRMHAAGYHHQDLYLCHILWPETRDPDQLYVIDLGRVQRHAFWNASRWVAKDLSQLLYSSPNCTMSERLRFFREYLQRSIQPRDRRLIRWLIWKAKRIERHTRRHGL